MNLSKLRHFLIGSLGENVQLTELDLEVALEVLSFHEVYLHKSLFPKDLQQG